MGIMESFTAPLREIRIAPPGLLLIAASVFVLYLTAAASIDPLLTYSLIAFAFLLALAGIALLFRSAVATTGVQEPSFAQGSSDVEEAVRQLGTQGSRTSR